ncbi:hypothetical protein BpHYR1_034755 [Brachionus plicatilis]|uniref:Uncharacterized protein n=1 Tax=Brachionus plicatilis TaxID=10195 RepID=A0A3M7PXA1_BRAPC|nr:hypothetical protein BpHYR1_034755 [Brachionus plicatilis]
MLELNNSITLVVGLLSDIVIFFSLNKNQTSLKKGNENGHIKIICLFLHKYFLNQDLSKLTKKNPKKKDYLLLNKNQTSPKRGNENEDQLETVLDRKTFLNDSIKRNIKKADYV